MRDAEGMPEDNVFVYEVFSWVGLDPFREAAGGLAGSLWDVAACWVVLGVGV
jgi:hypothetical protein